MKKGQFNTIEDYDITRDGKVINKKNGHVLKPQPNGKGYLRVQICGKRHFVHRLVAEKFIPNPDGKEQVNHIDGDRTNNSVDNLEWVTNQENRDHAVEKGLAFGRNKNGEMCPFAKLSNDDATYIRSCDKSAKELSSELGVTSGYIRAIRRGDSR